jgi:hypothetical protein
MNVAEIWETKNSCPIFGAETSSKWTVLRKRMILEENMRIYRRESNEIICEIGRWVEVAQDRHRWLSFILAFYHYRVKISETKWWPDRNYVGDLPGY